MDNNRHLNNNTSKPDPPPNISEVLSSSRDDNNADEEPRPSPVAMTTPGIVNVRQQPAKMRASADGRPGTKVQPSHTSEQPHIDNTPKPDLSPISIPETSSSLIGDAEAPPTLSPTPSNPYAPSPEVMDERLQDYDTASPGENVPGMRRETVKFIDYALNYLKCREEMDAMYLKVDEFQRIAKHTVTSDSRGIETTEGTFKPEYQQQSIKGKPVRTMNQLYKAAEIALPEFQELVQKIVDYVVQALGGDANEIKINFAPLKGRTRAEEKANDDYSKRKPGPAVSWLYDIVRASIEFTSADQILKSLEYLEKNKEIFHLVKAKN